MSIYILVFPDYVQAKWSIISISTDGETRYFLDYDRIRKHNGNTYYWMMTDRSGKDDTFLSTVEYSVADCALFKSRYLKLFFFFKEMGRGESIEDDEPGGPWTYPLPNSNHENILQEVCSQ